MTQPEPKRGRIVSVEYARALAALAVCWFHFTNGNVAFLSEGWLRASGQYGYLGVQVFFVISGFVIPYSLIGQNYDWRKDSVAFFARRVVRLEPPFLASCLLVVLLNWLSRHAPGFRGHPQNDLFNLIWHPLYLVPWVKAEWLNPVYWSLAFEFQFYIFVMVVAPALLSKSSIAPRAVIAGSLALSFLQIDPRLMTAWLPLFALGFTIFLGVRGVMSRWEQLAWFAVACLCAFLQLDLPSALAGLAAVAIIMVPWPSDIRWLAALGGMSYSLYLLHVPIGGRVINLATRLPLNAGTRMLALVCAIGVSIAAAYVFSRLIERPALRWSHYLRRGRTSAAGPGRQEVQPISP